MILNVKYLLFSLGTLSIALIRLICINQTALQSNLGVESKERMTEASTTLSLNVCLELMEGLVRQVSFSLHKSFPLGKQY